MNYYTKLIEFFKRNGIDNEEIFKYIDDNTTFIDYRIAEQMEIKGVYPKYNKQKKLIGFDLYIVPHNNETILLNIRPYIKAICAYYALGTEYNPNLDVEAEILAIHYEKLYLKENPNSNSQKYLDTIYSSIRKEEDNSKHKIALQTQEVLEKTYYNIASFEVLHEKAITLRKVISK